MSTKRQSPEAERSIGTEARGGWYLRCIVTVGGLLGWSALVIWGVPSLIRAGHARESITIINDIFVGRELHSVEFYLQYWRSAAFGATLVILGGLAMACLGSWFPDLRRKLIRGVIGGRPAFEIRLFLWYGFLLGFLSGTFQVAYRAIRHYVTQMPTDGFRWEFLWMPPASAAFAALVVALLVAAVARLGRTGVGVFKATVFFGFSVTYAVVQEDGIALYPLAEVTLALGLAVVLARVAASCPDALGHLVIRARPFLFGTLGILAILALVTLPGIAERRALANAPPADDDRPNVLFIVLDTVRAENLSLYGYERPTTTHLDEWAQAGLIFDRAFSTSPWTLPAHATMFTGRYPFETATGPSAPLDGTFPTLAEVLAEHGYATAGFVANLGYTSPTSGLARGFARYQAQQITLARIMMSSWLASTLLRPIDRVTGFFSVELKNGGHVTAEFLRWLGNRENDRPFFAFLNYFDAHSPYLSPERYRSLFGEGADGPWSQFEARWYKKRDHQAIRQLLQWMNQYDGALAYIDHQLGIIHDTLGDRGLLEETLVVVTSDHGESWGEHGLIEHGRSLYIPSLHVPLVISLPGVLDAGTRVTRAVTLRDLPSTILALVGLAQDSPLPGESLVDRLRPERSVDEGSTILAELERQPWNKTQDVPIRRGDMEALVEGNLHYIRNGDGAEELYNLDLDPGELVDLSAEPDLRMILSRFRSKLRTVLAGRQEQQ